MVAKVYKFIQSEDGKYILTDVSTQVNLYGIYRILGTVKVKGKRNVYEKIEIKNRYFNDDGIYLTERKNLTREILFHFITSCYYGDRSEQHFPYKSDLLDKTLLEDLGITVLTYKYFYSGNRKLCDLYYPVETENITDELKTKLQKQTEFAINEAFEFGKRQIQSKRSSQWNKV